MPDKGKDRRTPEEVAEHYKQKAIRRAAQAEDHYRRRDARRDAQVKVRDERREDQVAEREERRAAVSVKKERNKQRKASARTKSRKGGYKGQDISPEGMATFKPWDL